MLIIFGGLTVTVAQAQELVLPGDYPDPSVVKIGKNYWATATTSNWMPAFPILKSKDLKKWETRSFVFEKRPDWADYYFWAPEISYENGRVYVYYSAKKKDGNLCLGVASAERPEGPYKDHGPLMCQEVGSIDGFPMRDENGKLYLIWKEDANSVSKPTPIWISEMNEERTALIGEKQELFRNTEKWEGNLVEGVSMMRHGEYYYAFYAADACCGPGCNYVTGIARSKSLFGPWEKYQNNPVLKNSEKWKCPGHGTPVEMDGKYYFLYHAYESKSHQYVGRQGLLIEFRFTPEGWIEFIDEEQVSSLEHLSLKDDFEGRKLSKDWQWSIFQETPKYRQRNGRLHLYGLPQGRILGQKILRENFVAETEIQLKKTTAEAGLAAIGDDENIVSVTARNDLLRLSVIKKGNPTMIVERNFDSRGKIYLRMEVYEGHRICFSFSTDKKVYTRIIEENIDASYLPPWDRAIRAGLIARGTDSGVAVFDNFWMNK
ncbi:family 43 glycosylhydrolase [Pedobacter sp. SYSU D00535]|uniref:family 43 glycosylhydrolase n=1 Tax=Pedobacter sp. SYSU D00535 TaxID=2810308 RepID=UPI001A958900|nr:family 43 glycosylhydrolase [Pedobacter sp. SYSU D00535]